jgi:hypothetical protein
MRDQVFRERHAAQRLVGLASDHDIPATAFGFLAIDREVFAAPYAGSTRPANS